MAWFGGLWVGTEVVSRVAYFKNMAFGWRLLSLIGVGYSVKTAIQFYNGQTYGHLFGAYFRKYAQFAKKDTFEI